ncbi:MAG: class I tRNA ligase family protein [Oscillospiraceae bacterium]|nr:class I tRNA ligase family protein [Oscillospiraceae bacterium]
MTAEINAKISSRPRFPKRAVITGGMPYGNKNLHLGHIGGVFVHADVFARFLRDRIGNDNVIFVSGTDCYGSPITENYRELCEKGDFEGTIEEFVESNHNKQKEVLELYQISLNLYAASAIGRAAEIHAEYSDEIIKTLYQNGKLEKRSVLQFWDPARGIFLNGRQVVGRCPIAGCKSEKAYADECSLGHSYDPKDLIAPKSVLTGETPEMREAVSFYFKLDEYGQELSLWLNEFSMRPESREFVVKAVQEFLEPPVIYLKREYLEALETLKDSMPHFEMIDQFNKPSVILKFSLLKAREDACSVLTQNGIHFRPGKTLTPFRMTGQVEWGVDAPPLEGLDGQTIWVWPESLWAPISFVKTYLEENAQRGDWRDWWASDDCKVYQFIGQDNIYFYGPVESALFMALKNGLCFPNLIANNHVLFLDKKASSSSQIKPPGANELLDHYTPEQLRAHFLGLGLGIRSVSFQPKPFNPNAKDTDADPVLKEGNLLTGVMNRATRSCFYTAQKYTECKIPAATTSAYAIEAAASAVLDYEDMMARCRFHQAMNVLDTYIRMINKYWSKHMREADAEDNSEKRLMVLRDCFHMVRVAAVLLHPIAPGGAQMICEYFNMNDRFFCWDDIFEPLEHFIDCTDSHILKFLEPKVDFFKAHPAQIEAKPEG